MKQHQNKIFIGIAIVLFIGVGAWFYSFWQSANNYTTDNAKVSANLRNVMPASSSEVVAWNAEVGKIVQENELLGRLANGQELRAPIAGIVAKSSLVVNQLASPQSAAAIIADTSDVYVLANVEETAIAKVKVGQSVKVKLDAFGGKGFKGHVYEMDPVTVAALSGNLTSFNTSGTYTKVTQLIPVKIRLDEEVALKDFIGTNATVTINLDQNASEKDLPSNKGGDGQGVSTAGGAGGGSTSTKGSVAVDKGASIAVSGIVKAAVEKNITLDFSATVAGVPVSDGDVVAQGTVLMNLDLADIRKQISNLENSLQMERLTLKKLENGYTNSASLEASAVKSAEDNLKNAKDELSRQEALYQAGAVSQTAYDDAKQKVADKERALKDARVSKSPDNKLSIDIQRQKVTSMEADLALLKAKLQKSFIKGSDIVSEYKKGLVRNLTLIPGDVFMANTKVMGLVDLDSLYVEAEIPEHLIKDVAVGSKVNLVPLYDTTKNYSGKVEKISGMGIVKNGETLVLVRVTIDNNDGAIRPNFNVDVQIQKK